MANSHDAPRRHYLREWREFRGLIQDDLSLLAGTSEGVIADYETGERRIGLEMQYKLTWALSIT
jgi:predicted transcriptional regulator